MAFKINVVTRRVRVNSDGTRTVIEESSGSIEPKQIRGRPSAWIGWLVTAAGVAQLAYGYWAGKSDESVTPVFHAAPSCQTQVATARDSLRATAADQCRIESAVVVSLDRSSSRGSRSYNVVTLTAAATRDNTPLAGPAVGRFWGRLKPTQRVTVQRFVAPGYHLTGKVVAIADDTSAAMSRYHPDSGTHYDAMNGFLGMVTAGVGIALLVVRRRS